MNLLSRQGKLWAVLGGLLLFTAVATDRAVSRGASLGAIPLPVNVPIPDAVFHTDTFGNSVAMDGDTLVVGAPGTDVNGAENQGVAYIYTRNPDDPTDFTLLKSVTGSDSAKNFSFGWSVDIQGDTLVVGTAESGSFTTFVGTVYIFQRNHGGNNNWGEVKKITRDEATEPLNYFGRTLALHGDTLAVGAPLGLGKVFLFQRNQDGVNQWGRTQMLDGGIPITTTPRSASFGSAIVFDGATLAILRA